MNTRGSTTWTSSTVSSSGTLHASTDFNSNKFFQKHNHWPRLGTRNHNFWHDFFFETWLVTIGKLKYNETFFFTWTGFHFTFLTRLFILQNRKNILAIGIGLRCILNIVYTFKKMAGNHLLAASWRAILLAIGLTLDWQPVINLSCSSYTKLVIH